MTYRVRASTRGEAALGFQATCGRFELDQTVQFSSVQLNELDSPEPRSICTLPPAQSRSEIPRSLSYRLSDVFSASDRATWLPALWYKYWAAEERHRCWLLPIRSIELSAVRRARGSRGQARQVCATVVEACLGGKQRIWTAAERVQCVCSVSEGGRSADA